MLTRVLQRAGVRELSKFSVIINRNRRYDAVALQLRNVIVQRRMSAQPQSQQPQRIRRHSLAISQPLSMNSGIIQQVNVDESILNDSAPSMDQYDDIEINDLDAQLNASSTNETQEANNEQSDGNSTAISSAMNQSDSIEMNELGAQLNSSSTIEINDQQPDGNNTAISSAMNRADGIETNEALLSLDASSTNEIQAENDQLPDDNNAAISSTMDQPDDVEMNEVDTHIGAASTNDAEHPTANDENIDMNLSGGEIVTAFPGHVKKHGRKSFFNRSDMDEYVLKFQPSQTLRRRHSMLENRPPLSRMNRFSLDAIPEERNIDFFQQAAVRATTSKATTSNVTTNNPPTNNATTSSNKKSTGSGDASTEKPMFPRFKPKIPDLIPIVRR